MLSNYSFEGKIVHELTGECLISDCSIRIYPHFVCRLQNRHHIDIGAVFVTVNKIFVDGEEKTAKMLKEDFVKYMEFYKLYLDHVAEHS